jgi:integrase
MATLVSKHEIETGFYVQMQSNALTWFARFKIGSSWITKTTKERELSRAILKAVELRSKYVAYLENGIELTNARTAKEKWFGTIAENLIAEWEQGPVDKNLRQIILTLQKWHIRYFYRTPIHQIDELAFSEFRKWQEQDEGRKLTASTVRRHNVAFRKVFKKAVLLKHINRNEVPEMEVTGVVEDKRRAAFTEEEYRKVLHAAQSMDVNKEKGSRGLLPLYMEFCVRTGVRSGTETENILWKHLTYEKYGSEKYLMCNIVKGKTTKYTGTRKIVLDDALLHVVNAIRHLRLTDCGPDDRLFGGVEMSMLQRKFIELLKKLGMKEDVDGNARSLYSLRHSYITWQLQRGLEKGKIAKQCGTSEAMIDQHYSHVTPSMFARDLSGRSVDYIQPLSDFDGPKIKASPNGALLV